MTIIAQIADVIKRGGNKSKKRSSFFMKITNSYKESVLSEKRRSVTVYLYTFTDVKSMNWHLHERFI